MAIRGRKPITAQSTITPKRTPKVASVKTAAAAEPAEAPVAAPAAKPPVAKAPVKRAPAAAKTAPIAPAPAQVAIAAEPAPPAAIIEPPVAEPVVAEAAPEPVIETPAIPAVKTPDLESIIFETAMPETIAETITPDAVAPVATLQKEISTMEANLKAAAEKAQTYFTEATERAKAAVEKSTKFFEEANEFSKGNVEAVVESGKIAAKGIETLGQEAAEYSRAQFEGATAALKSFSAVKSPTDFFKLHSDYVKSTFDSLVAQTSKNTEAMLKLAGEVAQPISNRAALAAEKIKIAA